MIIIASQIAQISQYMFLNYYIFHNYTSSTKNYGGSSYERSSQCVGMLAGASAWHGGALGGNEVCVRAGKLGDVQGEWWMLFWLGWLWLSPQPSIVSSSVLWRVA